MSEVKSLRDLGIWVISKPGKAASGITGTWRTFRPVINRGKCNKCMVCWLYCPEGVISKDAMVILGLIMSSVRDVVYVLMNVGLRL